MKFQLINLMPNMFYLSEFRNLIKIAILKINEINSLIADLELGI